MAKIVQHAFLSFKLIKMPRSRSEDVNKLRGQADCDLFHISNSETLESLLIYSQYRHTQHIQGVSDFPVEWVLYLALTFKQPIYQIRAAINDFNLPDKVC